MAELVGCDHKTVKILKGIENLASKRGVAKGLRAKRVLVVLAAVAPGLAVWGIAQLSALELTVRMGPGVRGVGIGDVVAASLVAGLAAWTVHWLLARNLYGARWWPFLAIAVLAASIIAPSRLADGTASLALIAMHLAVGFVLIAGFNVRQRSAVDPGEQQQTRRPRGWRAGEARLLADDQGIAWCQARR